MRWLSSVLLEYDTEQYKDLYVELPKPCDLVGAFPSITEEQFEGLVSQIDDQDRSYGFERYMSDEQFQNSDRVEACSTAKESFISAIEADGWILGNPYGKKPAISDYDNYDHSYGGNVLSYERSQEYYKYLEDWQEAQQKVINLSNCYLFVKV